MQEAITKLVGILNITPDSFSDGGINNQIDTALDNANKMVKANIAVIDVGAESTRPSASPLNAAEEWKRLSIILPTLKSMLKGTNTSLSVDTYHYETAEKAISLGVDYINDVSGCNNIFMQEVIAKSNVKFIVMHNLGLPANPDITLPTNKNSALVVKEWAKNKIIELQEKNINKERIIIDPGIGFGKSAIQSLNIIKNIEIFHDLNSKIMVGHSRKSFLKLFTQEASLNRDIETYAASIYLSLKKVHYLRVHDYIGNQRSITAALNIF